MSDYEDYNNKKEPWTRLDIIYAIIIIILVVVLIWVVVNIPLIWNILDNIGNKAEQDSQKDIIYLSDHITTTAP